MKFGPLPNVIGSLGFLGVPGDHLHQDQTGRSRHHRCGPRDPRRGCVQQDWRLSQGGVEVAGICEKHLRA